MGTRNNPGAYDCYSAAHPDEPMFILLGRDPLAPFLVGWWAGLKTSLDPNADEVKVKEAIETAKAMDAWLLTLNREDKMKIREEVMQMGMRFAAMIEKEESNK